MDRKTIQVAGAGFILGGILGVGFPLLGVPIPILGTWPGKIAAFLIGFLLIILAGEIEYRLTRMPIVSAWSRRLQLAVFGPTLILLAVLIVSIVSSEKPGVSPPPKPSSPVPSPGPPSHTVAGQKRVLVLSANDDEPAKVAQRKLVDWGFQARVGRSVKEWNDAPASLDSYDAILITYAADPGQMPGERLSAKGLDSLNKAVLEEGKGLVTAEWFVYAHNGVTQDGKSMSSLLPVAIRQVPSTGAGGQKPAPTTWRPVNGYQASTYSAPSAAADHPIRKGLPTTLSVPNFGFPASNPGGSVVETAFAVTPAGTGIAIYETDFGRSLTNDRPVGVGAAELGAGRGRVVSLSTVLAEQQLNDGTFKDLMVNILNWVTKHDSP